MVARRFFQLFVVVTYAVLAMPFLATSPNPHRFACQKIYATLLAILSVFVYIWQISKKVSFVYKTINKVVCVLDAMGVTLIAFFNVVDILYRNMIPLKKSKRVFDNLTKVDTFLGIKVGKDCFLENITNYKFTVFAMHCIILVSFACDLYANGPFYGWQGSNYQAINLLLKYRITWFVVHLFILSNTTRQRFELLNQKFESFIRSNQVEGAVTCMKCHDMLCDVITKINKVYGFQMLILDKIIALSAVETSYLCLLYVVNDTRKLSVVTFINNFIWSVDFIICGALVCFSCGRANKAAQAAVVLCQNLYNSVKDNTRTDILMQFSKQVAVAKPEFKCLGFLPINYGSFFGILYSIFNYILIVLQFDI